MYVFHIFHFFKFLPKCNILYTGWRRFWLALRMSQRRLRALKTLSVFRSKTSSVNLFIHLDLDPGLRYLLLIIRNPESFSANKDPHVQARLQDLLMNSSAPPRLSTSNASITLSLDSSILQVSFFRFKSPSSSTLVLV